MTSKHNYYPRLDPGESTLPRKRLLNLQMEATVYDQATNLLPPMDPSQPPPDPAQPPAYTEIFNWLEYHSIGGTVKNRSTVLNLSPRTSSAKDPPPPPPEIHVC